MSGMLQIKNFVFGPFETNSYVVSDEQGNAFLIDPACSDRFEQQVLEKYLADYKLQAVIATHGHLDHLWGAPWVCEQWHMPVLMHEADIPMAKAMQQQYDLFGIRAQAQAFPIAPLTADRLPCSLIHTPGHTPGSVCLYWEKENVLLSGDTLFCMGYGRTDLPGGDVHALITSLQHLLQLAPETQVFPGHGQATTINDERTSLRSIFRTPLK